MNHDDEQQESNGALQEQLDSANPAPVPITPKLKSGDLQRSVEKALAQTGTGVTLFVAHTNHLDKMLELQAQAVADRIYLIDGELSRLLGERANAVAAYERLTGQKME